MCHPQVGMLNRGSDMRKMVMIGVGVLLSAAAAEAQNARVDEYLASAREIAGAEHASMVDRLCPAPVAASSGPGPGPGRGRMNMPRGAPDQDSWYAEPVKVFDNLYYVGMTEFSTWAVTTSDGIIIIDPIFDYSVEAEVVDGLRKLGFDPADIKYVIVSHGHGDHAGGAKFLQDTFGAQVLMGAADWDLVEEQNPSWKPERDIVVADDRQLTLGDTTLELHLTPGHTWGTISTLIPVRDGNQPHVAALWGGTLFNFGPEPERFVAYAESAERFAQLAAAAGADVLLSNHTDYDGSKQKMPALASRGAGERHPYVVGADSVRRYLAVAQTCAEAALAAVE
jgi:metallo-beta-lactamase class B